MDRPPRLSNAELVCLAVAPVLLDAPSEHAWLCRVRRRMGICPPNVPQQIGYNKLLRASGTTICAVLREQAGYAAYGCCSRHSRFCWRPRQR